MPGYLHIAKELGMASLPPRPRPMAPPRPKHIVEELNVPGPPRPTYRPPVDYGAEADRLQWEAFEDKYGKQFVIELEFIGAIMQDDFFAAVLAADRYDYGSYEITSSGSSGGLAPYYWRAGEITLFGKSMKPYFEMRDRDAVRHPD